MATSGSNDLVMTGTSAITEALEVLGVLGEGEAPNATQVTNTLRTLNYVLKMLQNKGLQLYKRKDVYLPLVLDEQFYEQTELVDDLYEFTVDSATTTSIDISDDDEHAVKALAAIDATYKVRYKDTNGTVVEKDISSTDANTINWSGAETVATTGILCQVYKARTTLRPHGFTSASVTTGDGNQIPIDIIGLLDWHNIPNKATTGLVNSVYYYKTPVTGRIYVWPVAADTMTYLTLSSYEVIEDMDAEGNDVDIPSSWFLAVVYELAKALLTKFGVPQETKLTVMQLSTLYTKEAGDSEIEYGTSVSFQPRRR